MKIRSPYEEPVQVPWLDDQVVNPGQVVAIPDELLPSFLAARWEPADKQTRDAAAQLAAAAAGESGAGGQAGGQGGATGAGEES